MKIKAVKILGLILLLSMAIPAVYARGPTGKAGKSSVAHLYLVQKDSNWDVIDGAWGKLKYNVEGSTFDYVFNGHGLDPEKDYSLIYYADPWPGNNTGALIANGTPNEGGNLHLMGSAIIGDLPNPADANYLDVDGIDNTGDEGEGAKIWLVPSSDYDAENSKMVDWNPTDYLFEYNLIKYDDTDAP